MVTECRADQSIDNVTCALIAKKLGCFPANFEKRASGQGPDAAFSPLNNISYLFIAYKRARRPRRRQILCNFRRLAEHVRQFRDVIEPAEIILDAGAGSDEFIFLMQAMGKNVVGIEPNKDYSA